MEDLRVVGDALGGLDRVEVEDGAFNVSIVQVGGGERVDLPRRLDAINILVADVVIEGRFGRFVTA